MNFAAEKVDLARVQFTPELVRCVPAEVAHRFELLPVFRYDDCLTVAFASTVPDATVIDEVFAVLCHGDSQIRQLQIVVADPWLLGYHIHKIYGDAETPST